MRVKLKVILIFAMLATSLLLLACVMAPSEVNVEISCDEFYENRYARSEVQVAIGDTILVDLCSNPTTGFQWSEAAEIRDPAVLEQVDHKYEPAEDKNIVGGAGKEIWAFKALTKGMTIVDMKYYRPFKECCKEVEWTYTLTVTVK